MSIYFFLLIDAALLIVALPLIFLIKGESKDSTLLRRSNKEKMFGETSIKLPDKEKLLRLEKIAQVQGSGIEFDLLEGNWKFIRVWKKGNAKENSIFSFLLRVFSANLEVKKNISIKNPFKYLITTSIQFGIVSIKFSGDGYLKGHQPVLPFFFNLIEIKSGSTVLFSRSLEEEEAKKKSFFALIASGESGKWLSARGQAGSLILWLKD